MASVHCPRPLTTLGISFALLPLSTFVIAQTTLEPLSVPITIRSQWCLTQMNTCGTLCSGNVDSNTCSPSNLSFDCTCLSNKSAPGLTFYQNTMPTLICEQIFANCVIAGTGDAVAQAACVKNEKANCGHLNPYYFVPEAGSVVTMSSSSATISTSSSSTGNAGITSSSVTGSSTGSISSLHQSSSNSHPSSANTGSSSTVTSTGSTQSSSSSSSPTSSSTTSPTQTQTPAPNSSTSYLSTGITAGIAIAAMFGILLL